MESSPRGNLTADQIVFRSVVQWRGKVKLKLKTLSALQTLPN